MGWFSGKSAPENLERTNARATRAYQRGNIDRGARLSDRADRQRADLEKKTGRAWELFGSPRRS